MSASAAEDAVWALYTFEAEQGDEISLRPGEKVIVLERDEQFQDGWWKGRNEAGQIGIFPESYISKDRPANRLAAPRPASTISRVSEESHGADSTKTGPLMGTSLSQALQDDTASSTGTPQPALSASAPASAMLNNNNNNNRSARDSHIDPSATRLFNGGQQERRDSVASFDSDAAEDTTHNLSKSQNWADHANARSTLAQRAKAQIDKAAREQQAKQQRKLYEQSSYAGSYAALPPAGLEFSDDSDDDEEQHFGSGLFSQHQQRNEEEVEAPKAEESSGSVQPRASTPPPPVAVSPPTAPQTASEASQPESEPPIISTEAAEDAELPGALPPSPPLIQEPVPERSPTLSQGSPRLSTQQEAQEAHPHPADVSQYSLADQSASSSLPTPGPGLEDVGTRSPELVDPAFVPPTATQEQPEISTTAPHSPPPTVAPPSPPPDTLEPTETMADEPVTPRMGEDPDSSLNSSSQLLSANRPPISSSSAASYRSNISDTSTTQGMADHFPHPPAAAAAAAAAGVAAGAAASNAAPGDQETANTSLQPTREEAEAVPSESNATTPQPLEHHSDAPALNPAQVPDATPVPLQQTFANAPETPVTDVSKSRPNSQLDSSAFGQPATSSVRTMDTSPRSSLASKGAAALDPRTWSVEQVVEWGRSKGYDAYTLGKFTEHEISGDVLVEMDVNTLKEIDLPAFGRRVHIFNGIKELRKMYEQQSQRHSSRSQLANYPSSNSLASPGMSGYDPDSPSTRAGFSPIPQLQSSGKDHYYNFAQSPDNSRTSYGSIDLIARDGYVPGQSTDPPRGLGLDDVSQPQTASSSEVPSIPQTSSAPPDATARSLSASARPLGELQEETDVEDRQVMSDNDALYKDKKQVHKTLQRREQNASQPSLAPSASSSRPSKNRSGGNANKRSSWYQVDTASVSNDLAKTFGGGKLPGSQIFNSANRRARKPAPSAPSVLTESSATSSSPARPKGRLSLSTMSKSSTRFFRSASGNEKETAPSVAKPTRRQVPQPPLHRSESQERAFDWVGQHDGPAVMGAPDPLAQIGEPDADGWLMKKNMRYGTWKNRYVVLKNMNLYIMKSPKETKVKGWVPIAGYSIRPDPDTARNAYGFKMEHPTLPLHSFASEDHRIIRKFQLALMKSTIRRDWNAETYSSSQVPTMSLEEAQAMYPPPRPPSPKSRSTIQAASRANVDTKTLSARDASLLGQSGRQPSLFAPPPPPKVDQLGSATSARSGRFSLLKGSTLSRSTSNLFSTGGTNPRDRSNISSPLESPTDVLSSQLLGVNQKRASEEGASAETQAPTELASKTGPVISAGPTNTEADKDGEQTLAGTQNVDELLLWVNKNLPADSSKATSFKTSFRSGELIYRLIKAKSGQSKSELEAPDAFDKMSSEGGTGGGFDHIETILDLFDFLLEQQVKTDDVSMNDLLNGHEEPTRKLVSNIQQRYEAA